MASRRVILALYLAIVLEREDFNTTQTWVRMFLNTPYVFRADIYFLRAVGARTRKKEERKKKMENLTIFKILKNT